MSENEAQDINQTIAAVLNSPAGANHFGAHKSRKDEFAGKKAKRGRRRLARKGSWNEALRLHARLLFRLEKYGETDLEATLLQLLRSCKPSRRCASAACPKCTYAVQCVMAALLRDLLSYGAKFDACLTIVPLLRIPEADDVGGHVEVGKRKWQQFRERLKQTFGEAGITAIGCIDVDTSEFPGGQHQSHCKPHVHALVFRNQVDAWDTILRRDFPNKGSVNRAVFVENYDGSDSWLRYMFKYPNSRKIRKKDGNGKWLEPAYKPPTVQQQIQQALLLDEVGWGGRLYLKGVELSHVAGRWRLVLKDFVPQVRATENSRAGR